MMVRIVSFVLAFSMFIDANAYEINNHADMTEIAALKSSLTTSNGANGKLFRLGLRPFAIDRTEQTFPLDTNLPAIPYCFGSYLPGSTARQYDQAVAAGQTVTQDPGTKQPTWGANGTETKLTIADFFRYGACFEDSEAPQIRPLAHFYNPQDSGAGGSEGVIPTGPSSLDWMLKRNVSPGILGKAGVNHYTWEDARNAFYYALTGRNLSDNFPVFFPDVRREAAWGRTFQALGHVMHHLQDMGSPQHTRNDSHCNEPGICAALGAFRPSGYEFYFDTQFQLIRSLAATATTPVLFGLPREFWNINTSNELITTNPTRPMSPNEGMAAYTSTNFTSAGKDFRGFSLNTGSPQILPASGLAFPRPSGQWNDVSVTELFPPENLPAVSSVLCSGNLGNCKMRFMGTEQNPAARTSATSVFSQVLLRPQSAYSGDGAFQQNYYTYSDAVTKLVPKAVEYSAGLINYFFRGEMEISLPEEGVYGIVDHAVTNVKGDGFKLIKMKVKNTTADYLVARDIGGTRLLFGIKFILMDDGRWKIDSM